MNEILKTRRGFSLIEMMVVITLSALLLGVATTLLFGLRERDRHTYDDSLHGQQLFRLAERLRDDIRQGEDVLVSIDGPLVVMSPDGEQRRYKLTRNGCVRSVVRPGDETSSNDAYSTGRMERWQVERIEDGRRPLVSVTLDQPTIEGGSRPAPLVVYAALGADVGSTARNENENPLPLGEGRVSVP